MRRSIVSCVATLAFVSACGRGAPAAEMPRPEQPRAPEPPATLRALDDNAFLLADNANVFADSSRRVLRDTIEWKAVWKQAVSRQSSPPPRPVVDFSREMVVLAAAGRMKPGDVIHVDSIGTRGNLTVIVIRTTKACQTFASDAFPFELARVPRTNGNIQFREHVLKAPECQ
jgi:hypothetical protein